jgi:hypothetical protein
MEVVENSRKSHKLTSHWLSKLVDHGECRKNLIERKKSQHENLTVCVLEREVNIVDVNLPGSFED